MLEKLKIIQAAEEHVDLAAPLFDQYRRFYRKESDLDSAREFIRERVVNKESVIHLVVHERDGRHDAVAFMQLYPTFSSVFMKPVWILNDMFVSGNFRRNGIGRMLLTEAQEFAREKGAKGLVLETSRDNKAARKLYESEGFKQDNEYLHYYWDVNDDVK